jgi:hypothetical protein
MVSNQKVARLRAKEKEIMADISLTKEQGELVLEHMARIMGDEHRVLNTANGEAQEAERLYNAVQSVQQEQDLPYLYVRILNEVVQPR